VFEASQIGNAIRGLGCAQLRHFVSYGIAPTVTGFAEGEVSKPSDKYVGGKGTQGNTAYS
jgi:hypothetical protein